MVPRQTIRTILLTAGVVDVLSDLNSLKELSELVMREGGRRLGFVASGISGASTDAFVLATYALERGLFEGLEVGVFEEISPTTRPLLTLKKTASIGGRWANFSFGGFLLPRDSSDKVLSEVEQDLQSLLEFLLFNEGGEYKGGFFSSSYSGLGPGLPAHFRFYLPAGSHQKDGVLNLKSWWLSGQEGEATLSRVELKVLPPHDSRSVLDGVSILLEEKEAVAGSEDLFVLVDRQDMQDI